MLCIFQLCSVSLSRTSSELILFVLTALLGFFFFFYFLQVDALVRQRDMYRVLAQSSAPRVKTSTAVSPFLVVALLTQSLHPFLINVVVDDVCCCCSIFRRRLQLQLS